MHDTEILEQLNRSMGALSTCCNANTTEYSAHRVSTLNKWGNGTADVPSIDLAGAGWHGIELAS